MDCIDCHNRPTHIFPTPDQALDTSLDSGEIDRTLPFVKREALAVAHPALPRHADRARADRHPTPRLLPESYPDTVTSKREAIERAISAVQRVYTQSFCPATKVDWQTYPDNLGHQRAPGCFRCHDGKHVSDAGQAIPSPATPATPSRRRCPSSRARR